MCRPMSTRSQKPNDFADDDDVEIEVVPVAPPVRKPRAINPEVDNVIASGEIQPRSLIVRSTESMRMQAARDDATEPTLLPNLPPPPKSRLKFLWLVAALLPALAAVGLMFIDTTPAAAKQQDTIGIQAAAEMIQTTFDAETRAAQVQVDAIATSSMLRAGIETNAETLADMVRDKDVVLTVQPGEVLEVFQLRDGAQTSLLRLPGDAPALVAPANGKPRIEVRGKGLAVVATAQVTKGATTIGQVVLAAPITLDTVKGRLADQTLGASITGLGSPIVLVPDGGKPSTNVVVPIQTKQQTTGALSLVALIPPPAPVTSSNTVQLARYGCMGLAGLLLVIFLVSLLRSGKG